MNILAIDTSSKICSVAILKDNEVITEKHNENTKTHSEKLMPMIDQVLKECNLNLKDFDLFACGIGPGSFTGVRIGVSTIKAFCDVLNIPVVAVNSLESLAYNTFNTNIYDKTKIICSIIDAKNDNVYCGIYSRSNSNELIQLGDLHAKNINEIINVLKDYSSSSILFVGDGAITHKYTILKNFSKTTFVEKNLNNISSISVGRLGLIKYNKGLYGDSNVLSPLYLKKSQAERAFENEN